MPTPKLPDVSVTPVVTVVIPTLNRPQLCALAIQSALQQADGACRVLVSENGSDACYGTEYDALFQSLPATVEVLRRAQRLRLEAHFPFLLARVSTPYVVLLADDDVLQPGFVQRAVARAEVSGAGIVFGPYRSVHRASGAVQERSFDFSGATAFERSLRFLCRRDDAFIYGLFRTPLLLAGMQHFQPLQVLGRRTLIRIAYAPLYACLLAAPYAHLEGDAVWVNTADTVKSEAYLGHNGLRKLVELLLGEWVLAARFLGILRASTSVSRAGVVVLASLVCVTASWYCVDFCALAVRRGLAAVWARLRRLARVDR
jgi:glycosyltransferase involved in cell wall biosynthesis